MQSPSNPIRKEEADSSAGLSAITEHEPHDRVLLTLGFAVAGWLLVIREAWTNPVLAIPPDVQFGLLEVVPLAYWLGLGLVGLSVALALGAKSDLLFVVVGASLLGLFAVTPGLFEPNAPVWDTYDHFTIAQSIVTSGHLPTDPSVYAYNWPGFYLYMAFLDTLGGLLPSQLVAMFPLFAGIFTFVALFVFLTAFYNAQIARPASVLSAVLCVWAQYHVSPQSVGLGLALLVLATAWESRIPARVANVALFAGLVVTHATSTIFMLVFLGIDLVLASAVRIRARLPERPGTFLSPRSNPFLAYAAAWLGWLLFVANGSAQVAKTAVVTQIGKVLQVGETTAGIVSARTVENIYVWPPRLRLAGLGIFGVIGFLGLVALVWQRGERRRGRFMIAVLVGLGMLALADILFLQGTFYDRALMFFAVFVPALALYGLSKLRVPPVAKRAAAVVLLAGALAVASTAYYQEAFNVVTSQSVAMSDFLSTHGEHVLAFDGLFPPPIWTQNQRPGPVTDIGYFVIEPTPLATMHGPSPTFAIFDPTAQLWYVQGRGIEIYQEYQAQRARYSLVYDNGFAQAYLLYSPPEGG